MKISALVLAGSLLANAALIGLLIAGAVNRPAPIPAPASTSAPAAVRPAATAAELWAEIHSGDLRTQIEKLQADGFPPSMIRAIVAAQVRKQFAERRKALETAQGELPFWKSATPDPSAQAALRDLWRDEQKAVKELLGDDPENSAVARLRRQFPNFSPESVEQLSAIRERYDEKRMELYTNLRGIGGMLPDEQAKIDALDKAMHAEIASVLTPPELEEYDLRTSNTANQLRHNLVAFDATEQEFRTLYKLQSAFDEQHRLMRGLVSDEQMRARSEAQRQLNDQIKAALGAERYEQYQRATDYNYRQTTQLVARLELPPDTADKLYVVQKEFEQRRGEIYRSGASPSSAPAIEQAKALQQEAISRVTPILGSPSRVEAYKEYGGSWITNMVPRSPPRPAPKS